MTDPLNFAPIATAGVDTSLPVLSEGDYELQCVASSVGSNKREDGLNWKLQFATVQQGQAIDGRIVPPNYPVFIDVAMQPAPDAKDAEGFKRGIGETIDALFGTTKDNRPELTPALVPDAIGKKIIAHVVVDEYKGQKSNKLRRLRKIA